MTVIQLSRESLKRQHTLAAEELQNNLEAVALGQFVASNHKAEFDTSQSLNRFELVRMHGHEPLG